MIWTTLVREPTGIWQTTDEFVVVWGEFGVVHVSREVGAFIADVTAWRILPTWVEFVDAAGALVRLRTRSIEGVWDSTPEVRARARVRGALLEEE